MSETTDREKYCPYCGELLDENGYCQFCNADLDTADDDLFEWEQDEYYNNVIAPQLETLNRR